MVNYSQEKFLFERLTSAIFFSLIFVGKMCVSTFLLKTVTPKNWLLIFFGTKAHSETKSWKTSWCVTQVQQQQELQTLEIVKDFACEDKTSEVFKDFAMFLSFSSFILIFLHFSSLSSFSSFSSFSSGTATSCSTVCCWSEATDNTADTSTNRRLRLRNRGTRRDDVEDDLGHFDNLLEGNLDTVIHQLSGVHHILLEVPNLCRALNHLRRRIIKNLQERRNDDLGNGASQNPLLLPDLRQPVRPRPAGLFFKAEELRLGCGGLPSRRRVARAHTPALASF